MRGDENTHSKGEWVKIPPFALQSRKKERDNGHDTYTIIYPNVMRRNNKNTSKLKLKSKNAET